MMNPDEPDVQHRKKPLLDLQPMSVTELKAYIASLEDEIGRAQNTIDKKEAHKSGAAALFGKK
jgi:uncharacterized small protein (DUF1192 family)